MHHSRMSLTKGTPGVLEILDEALLRFLISRFVLFVKCFCLVRLGGEDEHDLIEWRVHVFAIYSLHRLDEEVLLICLLLFLLGLDVYT